MKYKHLAKEDCANIR